ncbi:hypothetical protein [Rhodococcoides kroppenstedtii]|uniref:hypothetical protein n=1 Tax=Rhodococcoides kroppenstedtii TaxID=293050 RepID=UPI0036316F5F
MMKLIGWATLFGAVLGLAILGAEGIAFHLPSHEGEVIYSGEYVPLRGASMTDPIEPLIGTSLSWWNQLRLPWWSFPLTGAATGAVVAMVLALTGVRVVRTRRER